MDDSRRRRGLAAVLAWARCGRDSRQRQRGLAAARTRGGGGGGVGSLWLGIKAATAAARSQIW